jgi:hypothetical protein
MIERCGGRENCTSDWEAIRPTTLSAQAAPNEVDNRLMDKLVAADHVADARITPFHHVALAAVLLD